MHEEESNTSLLVGYYPNKLADKKFTLIGTHCRYTKWSHVCMYINSVALETQATQKYYYYY